MSSAAADTDVINATMKSTKWNVCSGCNCTFDRSVFASYTSVESQNQNLLLSNGEYMKVVGIGDVCFKTNQGFVLVLKNVSHAPSSINNYMSISALEKQGYTGIFAAGKFKLMKGSLMVAEADNINNMYHVEGTLCGSEKNLLWNKRLGYFDKSSGGLVNNNKSLALLEKPNSDQKPDFLKLVHMSVRGPLKTPSLNGSLYFVTFIDDYSRKIWCYTMKNQGGVLKAFKKFRSEAEPHINKKVKYCVFYGVNESSNIALRAYCAWHDISYVNQQTSAVPSSFSNLADTTGVSNNIIDKVESILTNAKLPMSYWDMALSATVHVLNLCPSVKNDVPDKVWFGKEQSCDHLRVFGCRALVHINIDTKRECIFVGYGKKGVGYKFYDPLKKETFFSSNAAEFFEDQNIEDIKRWNKEGQVTKKYPKK